MIKKNALKYLGYLDDQADEQTNRLLDECLLELEKLKPKFMYQIFSLEHHPLLIKELNLSLEYPDLIDLFEEGVTNGKKVLEITGKDVASFVEELLKNTKTYTQDWKNNLNNKINDKLQNEKNK